MIVGAILLAVVCWGFTFGLSSGNFWVKIGLSVVAVSVYSFFWRRPVLTFSVRSFQIGVLAAATLYLVFWVGNYLSVYIFSNSAEQVTAIYSLGDGTSRWLVFFLLLLITGPGEEIFWRGFLQSSLMARLGDIPGYLVTTAVYAAVHLFSGNIILTFAALVAGAFWGGLYLWKRDLAVLIVSHSLWSSIIFAIAPVGNSF